MERNTKMKKLLYGIIILGLALIGVGIISSNKQGNQAQQNKPSASAAVPAVTLQISDGTKTATYSNVRAQTPFEALMKTATLQNIPVKTKQYDFGVFVESVAGIENTKDKSWIYFVGGKSGDVASDKYNVKQDDVVEWKYTTPIY